MTKISKAEAERQKKLALREAVKTELIPLMAEFGFLKGKRSFAVSPGERSFSNYQRRRGDYFDEINIQWWSWNRPRFILNFWTDQPGRMSTRNTGLAASYYCRISAGRTTFLHKLFRDEGVWFGDGTDVRKTMEIARQRIFDLDAYLRFGVKTAEIQLEDAPPVMTRADPEVAKTVRGVAPEDPPR